MRTLVLLNIDQNLVLWDFLHMYFALNILCGLVIFNLLTAIVLM